MIKVILNKYKICNTEHERFIIIEGDMIEVMYNIYQNRIKELNDIIQKANREPSLYEVRKLKNFECICTQITDYLDRNNIPYTCMTTDNLTTLTIHGGITRTKKE